MRIKVVLCLTILMMGNNIGYGQQKRNSFPKKQLFEVFTSSTCGPCANANPIIDALLDKNEGEYSLIKYQVNWPGAGDIYYLSESKKRTEYYSVSGVPTLCVNGTNTQIYQFSQTDFDNNAALTTPMSIEVSASVNHNLQVNIETKILSETDLAEGLSLHLIVLENMTYKNVSYNGEKYFNNVAMGFATNPEGRKLEAFNAEDIFTFYDTLDLSESNVEEAYDLSIVAFVQDDSDKSIIQSEMVEVKHEFDLLEATFIVKDSEGNFIEEAEVFIHGPIKTDENGEVIFSCLEGTYNYSVSKAGLIGNNGIVHINNDTIINVSLEIPQALLYEDFDDVVNFSIPENWKSLAPNGGMYPDIFVSSGVLTFLQGTQVDDNIILVSPEVNLSEAGILTFDVGEKYYKPKLLIGTMSDRNDAETFVEIYEIEPAKDSMQSLSFDLSDYAGFDKYFALKMPRTNMNATFSLDNLYIQEDLDERKYVATLLIKDKEGLPVINAAMTIGEVTHTSDESGKIVFTKLKSGVNAYSLSATDFEEKLGEITITDNNLSGEITMSYVGVRENMQSQIKVFPNPVQENLHIATLLNDVTANIYTVDGKLIISKQLVKGENQLSLLSLQNGVYLVSIEGSNGITMNKRIVKH